MVKIRKEIDKELMYKKLMPSNLRSIGTNVQETDAEEPNAHPVQAANETLPELTVQRPIAPREIVPPLGESQPTLLINLMENIVLEKYDSILTKFHCCKCDRCKKDIIALTLNKLPPRYMVITKKQFTPIIDQQTNIQVTAAIIQALAQVSKHPRH